MNGQKNVLLTVPQNQGNLQAEQLDIRGMIHIIRGQQVILDSDLALLANRQRVGAHNKTAWRQ